MTARKINAPVALIVTQRSAQSVVAVGLTSQQHYTQHQQTQGTHLQDRDRPPRGFREMSSI